VVTDGERPYQVLALELESGLRQGERRRHGIGSARTPRCGDLRGKVLEIDLRAARGAKRALDRGAQLLDVARVRVLRERTPRTPRYSGCEGCARRELVEEVAGEREEVGLAPAKRGHAELEHVQTNEQLLEESTGRDALLQVSARRCYDPGGRRSIAGSGPLEEKKEPRLERGRQLEDLVQDERPAMRRREGA